MQAPPKTVHKDFSGLVATQSSNKFLATVQLIAGDCSSAWATQVAQALAGFCTLLLGHLPGANGPAPDLLLWLGLPPESGQMLLPSPGCRTACWLEQGEMPTPWQLDQLLQFDYLFLPRLEQLERLKGDHPQTHWLPPGCTTGAELALSDRPGCDVALRIHPASRLNPEELRRQLGEQVTLRVIDSNRTDEAVTAARILVLESNAAGLTPELFEALASGSLVMTDRTAHRQINPLFCDGEEYVGHCRHDLVELITLYLQHDRLRETIAARSRHMVSQAHTVTHRMQDLLAVALGDKPDTCSPAELRTQSLAGLDEPPVCLQRSLDPPAARRSFVIPVLDYSPASSYNIRTLLDDLASIDGEVLVVFNSAELGTALGDHPRITRHAIMKQNVGVARAWNIGISLADSDTVFILNADCHVTGEAVEQLHYALDQLPDACCVGPQGSFVNFPLCRDYAYFGKGSFSAPLEVDAVSGFFFAIRRDLFRAQGILFEEAYSPCYFEEWDTALQIRRAGLRSYIVPTTGYDHQWGGTIRSLRTIPYLGKEATAGTILQRNRQIFLAKWRSLSRRLQQPDLLESGWRNYLWNRLETALGNGESAEIGPLATRYLQDYPDDPRATALSRFAALHQAKQEQASRTETRA